MPIKKLTSAVDTMAGPCEDETTTLDTTMTDHSGLAWGADDDDDDEPQRRSWEDAGSAAAVILVGGVAAAVAVYVAIASSHHNDVAVSAPSARVAVTPRAVVPSVVTTVTEPPVTVTVTPAPTTAPATTAAAAPSPLIVLTQPPTTYVAPPAVTDNSPEDIKLFLGHARNDDGWTGSDAQAVQMGYRVCAIIATDPAHMKGWEAAQQLTAETGLPLSVAKGIEESATVEFCPQFI
jgi:hypothetical protein